MAEQKRRREKLDAETAAYYDSLTAAERAEHEALAAFSTEAAAELAID